MNGETISPLPRRMIEDMKVRKFVAKTQTDYIRHVKGFTIFLGRSPDTATAEDLRRYQLHLTENGVRAPSVNSAVSALRFFFSITLDRLAAGDPARSGGRGYLPRLRGRLAPRQCRPCEPRPAQGHGRALSRQLDRREIVLKTN
jgi:Phage integrase, N-terminal SAM-like domain